MLDFHGIFFGAALFVATFMWTSTAKIIAVMAKKKGRSAHPQFTQDTSTDWNFDW